MELRVRFIASLDIFSPMSDVADLTNHVMLVANEFE